MPMPVDERSRTHTSRGLVVSPPRYTVIFARRPTRGLVRFSNAPLPGRSDFSPWMMLLNCSAESDTGVLPFPANPRADVVLTRYDASLCHGWYSNRAPLGRHGWGTNRGTSGRLIEQALPRPLRAA